MNAFLNFYIRLCVQESIRRDLRTRDYTYTRRLRNAYRGIEIGASRSVYVLIAEVVKALKEHTVRKKSEEALLRASDEIRGTLNPIKWLS